MAEAELSTEPGEPWFGALSYCWGTSVFDANLFCDGKTLKITQGLAAALRRMRHEKITFALWVDQVCINQRDISERNSQVKLMGVIYSKAYRVIMWLGEEDEDVALEQRSGRTDKRTSPKQDIGVEGSGLKDLIERLAKAQEKRHEVGDTRNKHELQWIGLRSYGLPKMNDPGYATFTRLLQRQYFRRGWVLQEAALAVDNTVRIGAASVSLQDFYRAIFVCVSLGSDQEIQTDNMRCFMSIINMRVAMREKKSMDLLGLLLQTRATATTDPRDRIYCLLGLAKDQEMLQIEPNYADSVEAVYRGFTLRHIECYGNLDVLAVPRSRQETMLLPTWVTDWRMADAGYVLSLDGRDRAEDCPYRATTETRAYVTGSPDPDMIGLSGFVFDSVIKCGRRDRSVKMEPGWSSWRQIRHAFREHVEFRLKYLDWKYVGLLHTSKPYITGEAREDVFWQCLTAGRTFDSNTNLDVVKENYQAWSKHYFLHPTLRWLLPNFLLITTLGLLQLLRMLRTTFALFCWVPLYGRNLQQEAFNNLCGDGNSGHVMIYTSQGYMGLAPEATKEGDTIALLKGGGLPFVLEKEGENWTMHGSCYIHGIMYGEGFDDARCRTMWIR
ncbi:hypothetical protein G6514_008646 [Epicoccum nigrum]|nr:hypothetical protein G6514_008646 [Epicoccum nigrum]